MRSFLHNDEANAIVVSRNFGQLMDEIFTRDEQASQPVELERWKRRSLRERLKEFGVKLFGYWL